MQQIGSRAAQTGSAAQSLTIGQPVAVPPATTELQAKWTVKFPDGSSRDLVPDEKGNLLPRVELPGYHQILGSRGEIARAFVANPDPLESELTPIEKAALEELVPHEAITGLDNLLIWLQQREGQVPLWPVLLVLAVIAFVAEATYSNRLAHRRMKGSDAKIRTGRWFRRLPASPIRLGHEIPAGDKA